MTNEKLQDKIEKKAKQIIEELDEYDYSEIENEVLMAIIYTVTKYKQKLSDLKKELEEERFDCKINTDFSKRKRIVMERNKEGKYLEYEKFIEAFDKNIGDKLEGKE